MNKHQYIFLRFSTYHRTTDSIWKVAPSTICRLDSALQHWPHNCTGEDISCRCALCAQTFALFVLPLGRGAPEFLKPGDAAAAVMMLLLPALLHTRKPCNKSQRGVMPLKSRPVYVHTSRSSPPRYSAPSIRHHHHAPWHRAGLSSACCAEVGRGFIQPGGGRGVTKKS
jgi:hypothetical protein